MSDFDNITTSDRIIINFEQAGIPDVHRLGKYQYRHAHESLPEHAHPGMIEICYCEKGQQVYEVKGSRYTIQGGDVFVTFPGELHSTAHHPEEKGILYWLILKLDDSCFLQYRGEDAAAFVHALLNLPSRHFKGGAGMKKALDALFALHPGTPQPMHRIQVLNQLASFLLTIIQRSALGAAGGPSQRKTVISAYIADNLYNDLSVESLAAKMHLSASHFKSWFKKEFGMPTTDYILRLRVEKAKKLLQTSHKDSITDMAYQLNFSSSQYFATVFKKYTGSTPTAYRSGLVAASTPSI
ncbi:MAG: AraC family transcriptional regulator [Williamsia sp.]|nr:AraC family transcriptional regulator [Williamsia sp.]